MTLACLPTNKPEQKYYNVGTELIPVEPIDAWTVEEKIKLNLKFYQAVGIVEITDVVNKILDKGEESEREVPLAIGKTKKSWKRLLDSNVLFEDFSSCAHEEMKVGQKYLVFFEKWNKKFRAVSAILETDENFGKYLTVLGDPKIVYINGKPKYK